MNNDTFLWILGLAFGIIAALLGLLWTELRARVDGQENRLNAHETRIQSLETLSALFKAFQDEIKASITKIDAKLDRVLKQNESD